MWMETWWWQTEKPSMPYSNSVGHYGRPPAARTSSLSDPCPLPRYVSASCCPDTEHIPNRLNGNFYEKLKMDLTTTSSTIKDYLFSSGLRNGRVMDPQRNMAGLAPNDIWDSDPIHPKKCIYEKLAEGVREVEKGCGKGKRKRSADDTGWGADWS